MKLIVKSIFRDKTDHVTVYEPDTILEVKDKERAADLISRGLCAEYRGKKAAAITLGEKAPAEAEVEEAAPAEKAEDAPAEASTEGTTSKTEEAE